MNKNDTVLIPMHLQKDKEKKVFKVPTWEVSKIDEQIP